MAANKKNSRSSVLSKSISLSSNKGRLILFLLAFAVVGGGYMLYSSFASGFVASGSNIKNGGDAYTTNDCSGGKGCSQVWVVVPPSGSVYADFSQYTSSADGVWRKICFTAKKATTQTGQATLIDTKFPAPISNPVIESQTFSITSTTSYQKNCVSSAAALYTKVSVKAAGPGTNSNIMVSSISVE